MDRSDLLAVVHDCSEEAFRRLYARHTPALYAFARRMLADRPDDAEDVIQEVWLRAFGQLGSFSWGSSLRTWLSGIALNRCREVWRDRGVSLIATDEEMPAVNGDPHVSIDVERGLAQLPSGYRAVLVLHDVEGYTHEEIATQLGIEPGTSKSQLFRARRALRKRLHDSDPEGTDG